MAHKVKDLIKQLKSYDPEESVIFTCVTAEDFLDENGDPVLSVELFADFADSYKQSYADQAFFEDVESDMMNFIEDNL